MLKKFLSLFLVCSILSQLSSPLFLITNAQDSLTHHEEEIASVSIDTVKDGQEETSKKMVDIIKKADLILENYKKSVSSKGYEYLKDNIELVKENLDAIQNTKLHLIERANDLLEQDFEKKLKAQLQQQGLSQNDITQVLSDAEPNYLYEIQEDIAPNDPLFSNQWEIQNITNNLTGNSLSYSGSKVLVAVVDTGVNFGLPDLQGKGWKSSNCVDSEGIPIPGGCLEGGYDFVDNDTNPYPQDNNTHGISVASLVGAHTNNNEGMSSIAGENVEIMSLRACCSQGNFFGVDTIARAIRFAVNNNAKVINASFGGPTDSQVLRDALEYARDHGVLVVAAAGNYASNNDLVPIFPANYGFPNILSVGAISQGNGLSYFSNFGQSSVDIAAPGSLVYGLSGDGTYKKINGTSFATPLAVSVAARYLSQSPNLSTVELKDKILSTAWSNPSLEGKIHNGKQLRLSLESLHFSTGSAVLPLQQEIIATGSVQPVSQTGTLSDSSQQEKEDTRYIELMRKLDIFRKKQVSLSGGNKVLSLSDIQKLQTDLQVFIQSENVSIQSVGSINKTSYINLLSSQLLQVQQYLQSLQDETNSSGSGALSQSAFTPESFEQASQDAFENLQIEDNSSSKEVKSLSPMSAFVFAQETDSLKKVSGVQLVLPDDSQISQVSTILQQNALQEVTPYIYSPYTVEENSSPLLADLGASPEVVVNDEIQTLAKELNYNPTNILNYIRNTIQYEPYYGVKKNSASCLEDKYCNDVDTTSLAIALLRASGIPARYDQSYVSMSKDTLTKLLGVGDLKTAVYALASAKIPVYRVNSSDPATTFDAMDFTNDTHIIVGWTTARLYFDYDENLGNAQSTFPYAGLTTQQDYDTKTSSLTRYSWLPFDPTLTPSTTTNTSGNYLFSQTNFNAHTFFSNYISGTGTGSAIEEFEKLLKSQTPVIASLGASAQDTALTSYRYQTKKDNSSLPYLPLKLPYVKITGVVGGETLTHTVSPDLIDDIRPYITLEVKDEATNSVLLKYKYFTRDINNVPLDLDYIGLTQTDRTEIENRGGIHLTPASLVTITPKLMGSDGDVQGTLIAGSGATQIGNDLVLKFDYYVHNTLVDTSAKYLTAGNREGIFMNFSHIKPNATFDESTDTVLSTGNWAMAREYLKTIEDNISRIGSYYNREPRVYYSRAVVTQNRVLSKINNTATTFDFKGLTLDAHSYIGDYYKGPQPSQQSLTLYSTNQIPFRKVYGLSASYEEAATLERITGLTGISTVKGLRYAYAHPQDYTMHIINTSNEQTIDTLQYGTGTLVDLHTLVGQGYTLTIPSKLVTNQAWTGLFYTAVKESTGEGIYAIGERVIGNGGWTVDEMGNTVNIPIYNTPILEQDELSAIYGDDRLGINLATAIDRTSTQSVNFLISKDAISNITSDGKYYSYTDKTNGNVNCKISVAKFNDIFNFSNYRIYDDGGVKKSNGYDTYGVPCNYKVYHKNNIYNNTIDEYAHYMIMTSKGAKFKSESRSDGNYNYWKVLGANQYHEEISGTFVEKIWYAGYTKIYNPKNGGWYNTTNVLFSEYTRQREVQRGSNNEKITIYHHSELGFPTASASTVTNGGGIESASMQEFESGRIYSTYYGMGVYSVYGEIYKRYIKPKGSAPIGHSSRLGFPISDIQYTSSKNKGKASDGVECTNFPSYQEYQANFEDDFYDYKKVHQKIFSPSCDRDIAENLSDRMRNSYNFIKKKPTLSIKMAYYREYAKPGSYWDYKSNIYNDANTEFKDITKYTGNSINDDKYVKINGRYFFYDVPGNINGSAAKTVLSLTQLQKGAGCVQNNPDLLSLPDNCDDFTGLNFDSFVNYLKNSSVDDNGKLVLMKGGRPPYGDDPIDEFWLWFGYEYFDNDFLSGKKDIKSYIGNSIYDDVKDYIDSIN